MYLPVHARMIKPAIRGIRASGFSLTELLVASALSMIVMAALASLFSVFGRSVTDAQAMVELTARMRNAAWRLRQDLVGLTCMPSPMVSVECNGGYFAVAEGPSTSPPDPKALTGDTDDTLSVTTSSPAAPFSGRLSGAKGFESPTAEAVWFCEPAGQDNQGTQLYNLHRRQLLVAAAPDAGVFRGNIFAAKGDSDLSYSGRANSLGDLSKSANRFLATAGANRKLTGSREGEDVILGNVIAFDIKIVQAAEAVDGSFETRENADPAAQPLRGVEIRIRCVEPSSGRIRELKVVHSFGGP